MKAALTVVGVLMSLVGVVWILQGINILPGSFMTGVIFWAIAGVVILVLGVGLIVYMQRRPTVPGK